MQEEIKIEEIRRICRLIMPYLTSSNDIKISDSLYRTPAQVLREQADEIEKKDEVINEFRTMVEKLERQSNK
jgi:hypothetical protein